LIKPSALGDIIHALPVLTALRRRFPGAQITWVVNRTYELLLRGHPDLDATLPFDRGASRAGIPAAVRRYIQFGHALRQQQFDLVVDLQGLFRSGLMVLATGAARRVGLSTAREGATCFYTDVIRVSEPQQMHAVDRYWRIAETVGVGDVPKLFRLPLPQHQQAWAMSKLSPLPRPWLTVGLGARWLTKRWPPGHFAALLQRAANRFGGSAIFVGGRDEMTAAQWTRNRIEIPSLDLTGQTTLSQLAAVLSYADVMIANDTGPLHLAAALGRPVVAPYTCTSARRNGPYGQPTGAVESLVWCQGSYVKRCRRLECMAELTPERLWPVLDEVLRTWRDLSRSA
jgi:lipopolysaccharide heptosyltransferase I